MNQALKDKTIVLTGVSRGVGRATAELLLAQGAEILGVSKDPNRLKQTEAELGSRGKFHAFCQDLGVEDAAERIAEEAARHWDQLDILINNAGVMLHHEGGITEEPAGVLERSLELNLLAPFRVSRALLPLLRRSAEPRIVHVSSGAGTFDGLKEPGIASYRLSKWALNGLILLQAQELLGSVIVNGFDPGWVRTDLGGERAPGTPQDSARGLLKSLTLPVSVHGKFLKDGEVISW